MVCYGHGLAYWGQAKIERWTMVLPFVPTFLAISGYVVFQSYEASRSWSHFVWKRILRIFPGLFLAFALSGLVWGYPGLKGSILSYLGGGKLPGSGGDMSLWSLGWEELAYLLLAILVGMGAYRARWPIWVLFVCGLCLSSWTAGDEAWWRPANLAPAFFAGNLVYIYREKFIGLPWGFGVGGIAGVWGFNQCLDGNPQNWYTVGITAFCILIVGLNTPGFRRLPLDISYGLYVFHDPVFAWTRRSVSDPVAYWVFSMAVIVVLSVASWFGVERHFLKLKKAKLPRLRLNG